MEGKFNAALTAARKAPVRRDPYVDFDGWTVSTTGYHGTVFEVRTRADSDDVSVTVNRAGRQVRYSRLTIVVYEREVWR